MLGVLRHAGLRWNRVLRSSLDIVLVCECRRWIDGPNVGHVTGWHVRVLRHRTALLLLHVVGGLFRRVDLIGVIDPIFVALAGLRRVQTSLRRWN